VSWLLDVNVILASRWRSHPEHASVKAWLESVDRFHTCPIAELGFVRISMNPAYGASWDESQAALRKLRSRSGFCFLPDDVDGTAAPESTWKKTTDAHLIALAARHQLQLATLDMELVSESWAAGIAVNPLADL